MNDTLRSIKELPFSHFPKLKEGWRTVEPGSEQVVNTHDLLLQGEGERANAAQARS